MKLRFQVDQLIWILLSLIGIIIIRVNLIMLEQSSPEETRNLSQASPKPSIPPNHKKPLIDILKAADIQITPNVENKIPSWQQVNERFGDESKVIGMETCEAFRQAVPERKRMAAPAGMFNSGTNFLHNMMLEN